MSVRACAPLCYAILAIACSGNAPTAPSTQPTQSTPPTATRIIGLSGNLAFGNVEVGQIAKTTLTITNTGNAPLTVTGLALDVAGFSDASLTGFNASMRGTVGANGSTPVTVFFSPQVVRSYSGVLTVIADQTGGTNTIGISGTGTFSGGPMFTIYPSCNKVTRGTTTLGCVVYVTTNGTTTVGMVATADSAPLGLSKKGLSLCWGCGGTVFDLDLKIPADIPIGPVPITFTVTDVGGRTATATADLQVVQ